MRHHVVYAAVRRDEAEGREWIDLATVGYNEVKARSALKETERREGREFTARNPVVRIVKLTLSEED